MKRASLWLGLVLLLSASSVLAQSAASLRASAEGAVGHSGSAVYPSDARLSTVALAARVDLDAYLLGAAWLRPELERDQLRLHAGVVYELGAIRRAAMASGDDTLADAGVAFQRWFAGLPVTGRRTGVTLDPSRLEVTPSEDWPVHDGDRLFYPRRPSDIRVVGAVGKPCRLPQVATRDARRYLADCPRSPAADPDAIYVVQPDGVVFRQNVALWNRDPARVLAPGAWIYVPFAEKAIAGATDGRFNLDVADFLATQLLDEGAR